MKTHLLKVTAIFMLALSGIFYSCEEKNPTVEPFLTVDETPVTVKTVAGNYSIAVGCNGEWTAIVEDATNHDWCTLTNASGNGNGTITVNLAENTSPTVRTATVKITLDNSTKSVLFTQAAAEAYLTVDETPISASAEAGTYSIAVGCNGEWTAIVEDATSHAWCTLTKTSGKGNGTITVNVAENTTTTARSATVKISSGVLVKSVVINQETAESYPKDIPFTDYSLAGISCQWENFELNKLIIINSSEELENHVNCTDSNYPEFDFSKYTLLLARGVTTSGHTLEKKQLQQISINEYSLYVDIKLQVTTVVQPWRVIIKVPKLSQNDVVTLNVNVHP